MLAYIIKQKNIIGTLFNHLYLTNCITDLIVRIASVKDIGNLSTENYKALRSEVLQNCINSIDHHGDDDFITE